MIYQKFEQQLDAINHKTKEERHREMAKINSEFSEAPHREYLYNMPTEVSDVVFYKAWEDRHAYGYSEVESHYSDLAEFVEKLVDIVQESM